MDRDQNLNKDSERVEAMFNGIAHRYDFLNHFLSLGIDKIWRKKLIRKVVSCNPKIVLDIATGTADLAIQLAKTDPDVKIIGIDISSSMLEVGQKKVDRFLFSDRINLRQASSLEIPFESNTFDASMVAFGVRNFSDPVKGMNEAFRVLKVGGKLFVLEFSMPKNWVILQLYKFYFKIILPTIGRIISGHKMAYAYLPESVTKFPDGDNFIGLMCRAGFSDCSYKTLSFGIATLYEGVKVR